MSNPKPVEQYTSEWVDVRDRDSFWIYCNGLRFFAKRGDKEALADCGCGCRFGVEVTENYIALTDFTPCAKHGLTEEETNHA